MFLTMVARSGQPLRRSRCSSANFGISFSGRSQVFGPKLWNSERMLRHKFYRDRACIAPARRGPVIDLVSPSSEAFGGGEPTPPFIPFTCTNR